MRKWIFAGLFAVIVAIIIFMQNFHNPEIAATAPAVSTPVKPSGIIFDEKMSDSDRVAAAAAMEIFKQNYDLLFDYHKEDIEWINVSRVDYGPNYDIDFRWEDYGWKKHFEVQVKIKDRTETFLPDCEGPYNVLYFFLGRGKKSGIDIGKGWDPDNDRCNFVKENVLLPVPEMATVNNL
jgi:hypothetical protein